MVVCTMPCGNFFNHLRRTSKASRKGPVGKPKEASTAYEAEEVLYLTKKHTEEEDKSAPKPEPGTFEIERLPTPNKSATDENEYSVIRLSNGVVATIVAVAPDREKKGRLSMESRQLWSEAPFGRRGSDIRQTRGEALLKIASVKEGITSAAIETSKSGLTLTQSAHDLERGCNLLAPTKTFAACAVTVEVGSFNDPDNIPGLCHLLEHVLSMGTDKFKGEDEFDAFLGQNGGFYDAETETEYMTFYFHCQDTVLFAAMEMFSRFFVAPLIKWDSVRRERHAVASEFSEQQNSNNARRMQIICTAANSNNPARRFVFGNLETLKNHITDDTLLNALKDFRKTNFTADRIKVAVHAMFPVETLEGWVNMLFSDIPKRVTDPAVHRPLEHPFDNGKFCKLYKVQSIGDICEVNINWVVPPMDVHYKSKPIEYISYVIGAEGEGSLISYLRKQQMALYLTSEVEDGGLVSNSLYTIFTICVSLTEEGSNNIKTIVKSVFGYLKMLRTKSPSESIWSELRDIADIRFKYSRTQNPTESVRLLSQSMAVFPTVDYLTGWTTFFEFSGEEIQKYLSIMTPANANVLLHMKNHEEVLDKEEQWFKTKYRIDDIPASWIQEWNSAVPEPSFDLPFPNPYIPDDFGLVGNENEEEYPQKVVDANAYEIWHLGDGHFNVPYASVHILLGIPQQLQTPQNLVCQMLFAKMFVYQMIDELYFAEIAHIEHKMVSTEYGLEISIFGLSQKLPKLLKEVARGLVEFREKEELQLHMLKYLKVVLQRNAINTLYNGSLLIEDLRKSITSSLTYATGEKFRFIRGITKENLDEYWHGMLENMSVVALVQGNISANKAKSFAEEFAYILEASKNHTVMQPLARMIPLGESIVCLAAFHPQEENCYTQFYYQFGVASIIENVALQLFVATMREPLFDELRTKEQLGYSVSVNTSEILGVIGVIITVNSQINRHSPEYIRTRIDTFVRDYHKYFRVMSRAEFDEVKNVFLAMKQMRPETLREESARNWWEIKNRGEFDRLSKEVEAISKLDKRLTIRVVDRTMDASKSGASLRKLVMQVVGFRPNSDVEDDERSTIIDDLVMYRNTYTDACTPSSKTIKDVLAWKNSLPTYVIK